MMGYLSSAKRRSLAGSGTVFMSSLLPIVTRFRAESESSQGLFLAASITITGWPAPLD
jgi:hypothetical protein